MCKINNLQSLFQFQLDQNKSLFDQSSELPYDTDFEFPRERLRMVNVIGSGNFGKVWLAQAYEIRLLDPRNKSEAAKKQREEIRTNLKGVGKSMDTAIRDGNKSRLGRRRNKTNNRSNRSKSLFRKTRKTDQDTDTENMGERCRVELVAVKKIKGQ